MKSLKDTKHIIKKTTTIKLIIFLLDKHKIFTSGHKAQPINQSINPTENHKELAFLGFLGLL